MARFFVPGHVHVTMMFTKSEHAMNMNRSGTATPRAEPLPPLLAQCVRAMEAASNLRFGRFRPARGFEKGLVDGAMELRAGKQRVRWLCVLRPTVQADIATALLHLHEQVQRHGQRLLVCCRKIPRALRDRLRGAGIGMLDATGLVVLEAEGVLVQAIGRSEPTRVLQRTRTTGTDFRLLHVVMRRGETGAVNQRQLATEAGIALGAVGKGLRALEARGLLRRRTATNWAIVDPVAAQACFVEGWATIVRTKLDPRRFQPMAAQWSRTVTTSLANAAPATMLGGELAAARFAGGLATERATLHVPRDQRDEVVRALRLLPDDDGPVTLVDRFGAGDDVPDPLGSALRLAHPLLVHAELVTLGDERLSGAIDAVWGHWMAQVANRP